MICESYIIHRLINLISMSVINMKPWGLSSFTHMTKACYYILVLRPPKHCVYSLLLDFNGFPTLLIFNNIYLVGLGFISATLTDCI